MIKMITHFAIYGVVGLVMEIAWTGFVSAVNKNFKLYARTSVWMFFIYGCAAFIEPLCDTITPLPIFARGWIYTVCIFAVEFATGKALSRLDICPWDYAPHRYSVMGVIRVDYAPLWFLAGLMIERVHFLIK